MAVARKTGKREANKRPLTGRLRTFSETGPLRFARDTLGELRRSQWPTREETLRLTVMVLGVCIVLASFLGMVDFGLARLADYLFR